MLYFIMTKEEKFKIQAEAYQRTEKWARMMVKSGELKIGDDKIIDGQTVYGWVGTDEIASSIMSYIDLERLLNIKFKP